MASRRLDVDVVRAVALASMYVAHVAPTRGPAHVLELSEFLTMPLFALVIGVSAQLGVWSHPVGGWSWWRSTLVRGAALVGVGLALDRLGAQVVIVLVHLGALVVVAGLLARVRSAWTVVGAGVAALAATLLLMEHSATAGLPYGSWSAHVQLFVWAGGPYRLGSMVVHAALGIVLARWWLRGRHARSVAVPTLVGGAGLVLVALALAAEQFGLVDLVPYSGTAQETLLDAVLAASVLGVGLGLTRVAIRLRAPGVGLVAAVGAMTLTLYALQIVWLAWDTRVWHPGERDDSWANLAILAAGSLLVAAVWRQVVRRGVWRRGPLEGAIALLGGGTTATR